MKRVIPGKVDLLYLFSKDSASNSEKQPSASHGSPVIPGESDPVPIPANGCFLSVLPCSCFVTQMLPEKIGTRASYLKAISTTRIRYYTLLHSVYLVNAS